MPISATGISTTDAARPNAATAVRALTHRPASGALRGASRSSNFWSWWSSSASSSPGDPVASGTTGKDREPERERDRLAAIAAYVRERGAMLTLEYGLRCGQHGYRFTYYDNRALRWLPETVDDTLRPRKLPAGLRLRLVVEGREIVLDDAALTINPASTLPPGGTLTALGTGVTSLNVTTSDDTPQIMLFSNGDTNSFALTIVRDGAGRTATLQSTQDGTLKVGDIIEPRREARGCAPGFTLLEVLVALAIVALGMGALLSSLTSSADNVGAAREDARRMDRPQPGR